MNARKPYPNTLIEAIRHFTDLDVAHEFFVNVRWPDGVVKCPTCGAVGAKYLTSYRRFQCVNKHPRRQFTVKVGTIMEDSPIGLDKWAVAFWLECNAKNSISSYEVHRALGITQKSAWFMQHRIRLAMQTESFTMMGANGSPVEADESFIGGLARNMHKSKRAKITGTGGAGKTAVMGLLERHGGGKGHSTVKTFVMDKLDRESLHAVIHKHVDPGTHVCTDAALAYRGLEANFIHGVIDHAEKYVDGIVHTNGLENFWALFKRCIKGTHVSVEPFHLFRYLDSEGFRFNHRQLTDGERLMLAMSGMSGKRLTYKALIGLDPERRIADDSGADLPN